MLEEEKATATIAPSNALGLVKKFQLFHLFNISQMGTCLSHNSSSLPPGKHWQASRSLNLFGDPIFYLWEPAPSAGWTFRGKVNCLSGCARDSSPCDASQKWGKKGLNQPLASLVIIPAQLSPTGNSQFVTT